MFNFIDADAMAESTAKFSIIKIFKSEGGKVSDIEGQLLNPIHVRGHNCVISM